MTKIKEPLTNIIRSKDSSFIAGHLNLKPGSTVIEAGIGCANLSLVIMQNILPKGFLYSFDINESSVEYGKDVMNKFNYFDNFKFTVRDVCLDGFGLDENVADAIVLDLPSPSAALDDVRRCLKSSN